MMGGLVRRQSPRFTARPPTGVWGGLLVPFVRLPPFPSTSGPLSTMNIVFHSHLFVVADLDCLLGLWGFQGFMPANRISTIGWRSGGVRIRILRSAIRGNIRREVPFWGFQRVADLDLQFPE